MTKPISHPAGQPIGRRAPAEQRLRGQRHPLRQLGQLALLAAGLLSAPAWADGDKFVPRTAAPPTFQQECSACHVAYAPALLPASSWQRLMADLPRHFGTDASLDAATQREISTWLVTNAGTYKKVAREASPPPEDRISRAPWFVREHREVPAGTWLKPTVKSASHCAACHTRAEQGDFSERNIHIPR